MAGSIIDLRYGKDQTSVLTQNYHVIKYSQWNKYQNSRISRKPDHSAIIEAEGLLPFIDKLKLG